MPAKERTKNLSREDIDNGSYAALDNLRQQGIPDHIFPSNFGTLSRIQQSKALRKLIDAFVSSDIKFANNYLIIMGMVTSTPAAVQMVEMGLVPEFMAKCKKLSKGENSGHVQPNIAVVLGNWAGYLRARRAFQFSEVEPFFQGKAVSTLIRLMKKKKDPMVLWTILHSLNELLGETNDSPWPAEDEIRIQKNIGVILEAMCVCIKNPPDRPLDATHPWVVTCVSYKLFQRAFQQVYGVPDVREPTVPMKKLCDAGAVVAWARVAHDWRYQFVGSQFGGAMHALSLFKPYHVKLYQLGLHKIALDRIRSPDKAPQSHIARALQVFAEIEDTAKEQNLTQITTEFIQLGVPKVVFDCLAECPISDQNGAMETQHNGIKYLMLLAISNRTELLAQMKRAKFDLVSYTAQVLFAYGFDNFQAEVTGLLTFILRPDVPTAAKLITETNFVLRSIGLLKQHEEDVNSRDFCSLAQAVIVPVGLFPAECTKILRGTTALEDLRSFITKRKNDPLPDWESLCLNLLSQLDDIANGTAEYKEMIEIRTIDRGDPTLKLPKPVSSCAHCGNMDATKKCGNCKAVVYCGRDCQTNDWKIHKLGCQKS
eukprot:TRINITY_DN6719_c0_g1_i2.p1 TRINITY_DN6719_c0_g1~~TRINITY_DN6719_c0_g1_i2.p1  ORF type:complete len:597 (-),score=72.30 TRINITY_DN6719_c0_g1_i2:29-1819(-)